ncbi:hypothetical protein FQA39_LY09064 [Lamprigera yunnana]|nr:hypothetical protein FQA39_LY09064 [Lamprigera yunnana]
MDVDYNETYLIKSDITVQETFSYCGNYEDYGNEELKTEPVDVEKYFKCEEEENIVELIDVHAVPIQEYICNECSFITTEKEYLVQHLNIIKNCLLFLQRM